MAHGVMPVRPGPDGRVLVDATTLAETTGWQLKPEGLCRADVCVPVRDPAVLAEADRLDLVRVATALDRPVVFDAARSLAALGEPAAAVADAMGSLHAPDVVLPDLHGNLVSIHDVTTYDLGRRKRLLLAWSSW